MSASVLNTILAQLATDLAGITVAAGYSQTVQTVTRAWPNETIISANPQPAIYLFAGPIRQDTISTDSGIAVGEQGNEVELNVVFLAQTQTERERVGMEFAADVETVLTTPTARQLGGTTLTIEPQVVEVYTAEIYGPQAGGHYQFSLRFTTRLGQPRVGTA